MYYQEYGLIYTEEFLKELVGRNDIEDALEKLDT